MQRIRTAALAAAMASAAAAQTTVFSDDFDSSMPTAIQPGTAQLDGVQGYAGLGPPRSMFGGSFLRSAGSNIVTLTLTSLPPHQTISLDLLFAAIDSLDGSAAGDYFRVELDGVTFFRESFANALPSQVQSYVPPPGGELARRVDLGFSGPGSYFTDSAYDFGIDAVFAVLPHTAPTATFTFEFEGNQSLGDESWAMDNLRVVLDGHARGSVMPYGTSCGPQLAAQNTPQIGTTMSLTMSNLPSTTTRAYTALGLSDSRLGPLTLPLPLDPYGMPGCWLLQDMGLIGDAPMTLGAAQATLGVPIPNDLGLIGARLFLQGYALAPGVNLLGAQFSAGLRIIVGG